MDQGHDPLAERVDFGGEEPRLFDKHRAHKTVSPMQW